MNLNFFNETCQSIPVSLTSFGLCDKEDGTKAYIDTGNSDNWIAEVKNDSALEIIFTAIDKCILQDSEFAGRGRCDGMLTTINHLFLVELKNQKEDWIVDAKKQLTSTIDFLLDNHDIKHFRFKKAFACNRRRRCFAFIDNEENLTLFRRTGFRIDVQAEIVII